MNLKYFNNIDGSWLDISGQPGASLEYDEASGWVTSGGYKKYVAQISQSGSNAPNPIVLENTLGFEPLWEYDSNGVYGFNWDGDFDSSKSLNYVSQDFTGESITYVIYQDAYDITLKASKGDDYINKQTLEIRYYN
jgi:hypothetical protein